ncbi:MAG: hypothetical protein ABWX94_01310 [Candidatus Saccharimonadales bacterium]
MSETSHDTAPVSPIPDLLLSSPANEASRTSRETAEELRAAQEGWLERRGVLEDTRRLTMTRQEFNLLREVGTGDGGETTSFLIDKTKESYGIPLGAEYALIDVAPDDAEAPRATKLVVVHEDDFGTAIDQEQLEGQGTELEDITHLTMTEREFGLFRSVGMDSRSTPHLIDDARELCGIPQEDQYFPEYALVDIKSDDPNQPNKPLLVVVSEPDFGTTIDHEVIARDFQQPDLDPNDPTPESPIDALATVNIKETLIASALELEEFANSLMTGPNRTEDPFADNEDGEIGIRAGGLMPGQEDAYVWTVSPLTKSLELTLLSPSRYDSVCIVRGQKREAPNGKLPMAQIVDPSIVLEIKGEQLEELQDIYKKLYHEPEFALTEMQKKERDQLCNDHLQYLISDAAKKNSVREQNRKDDERRRQRPQLRARQMPR